MAETNYLFRGGSKKKNGSLGLNHLGMAFG